MAVTRYFNVTNPPKLIEYLEEDPFINHALTSVCCELYYKYGMYIAPFTAILTTARHIDFNTNKNIVDKNGKSGESDQENQNLNQESQILNQESKTQEPNYPKPKNPKRVAAGKKDAEARCKKKPSRSSPTGSSTSYKSGKRTPRDKTHIKSECL